MKRSIKSLTHALGATAACLLAGCGTTGNTSAPPENNAVQITAKSDAPEDTAMTGSRIPRKSTDRMVRQIGAAGAKESERDRPPSPGPTVQ